MRKTWFISVLFASQMIWATTISIAPSDARRIYNKDESIVLVLDALSVAKYSSYENRSFLEFDVSGLSESIPYCTLDLSYGKFFDGAHYIPPSESIIDVFAYTGNGVIAVDDFSAGGLQPFTSFIGENNPGIGYGYISIDVTSIIQEAIAIEQQFVGFRLSTETEATFDLGWGIGVPDPVLTIIPEPATVLLLGLGGLTLRKRRKK